MGSKFLVINPGTMPGDADLAFAFKASAEQGGITITKVTASTGAVGTLDLLLVNYGTSGTVVGGTIAHMASGTAETWAVDTPQEIPITAAQAFVDAEECVFVKKLEAASGNDLTADAAVVIEYVDGIVTQG